jgi:hypothetical protein
MKFITNGPIEVTLVKVDSFWGDRETDQFPDGEEFELSTEDVYFKFTCHSLSGKEYSTSLPADQISDILLMFPLTRKELFDSNINELLPVKGIIHTVTVLDKDGNPSSCAWESATEDVRRKWIRGDFF